jgi:exodeoxyribonuclease III
VKVISWNLAGRLRRMPQQVKMLASRTPDLVALQEVVQPGLSSLQMWLADGGLIHQADGFQLAPCPTILTGPRRYGLLIASRFPLCSWQPGHFKVPSIVIDHRVKASGLTDIAATVLFMKAAPG